jgi:hypothetical protein
MENLAFDDHGRFVIRDYAAARPFTSFLPGIAGRWGIPMWVFYVNRGQAITSFGVENKDSPILEFQPANKAYQTTPYTGFRTFIRDREAETRTIYEPFSPWQKSGSIHHTMFIGMNELELQEEDMQSGLQTNVVYFTLPGENMAGLARCVTLTNISDSPRQLEVLDGLPAVIPYGVNNWVLKEIGRTIEAWMAVFNLEQHIPFYRLRASAGDTAEVEAIRAGHFGLAYVQGNGENARLLPAIVDPELVFGQNTPLSNPDGFQESPVEELLQRRQITSGRTPCGFFGTTIRLAPAEATTICSIFGHASSVGQLNETLARLLDASAIQDKRREAQALAEELTDVVATKTQAAVFDAYCRQTFLDNVLRGGWPVLLGDRARPTIYHIYSRKHGDPERDYNAFFLAAEYYSQGNGNYRDVNQNRRCDVFFNPQVADYNIRAFMSLIQADGYNPLVVQGSRFTLPAARQAGILGQVKQPDLLAPLLAEPFTPGQLLKHIDDHEIAVRVAREDFLTLVLGEVERHFEAEFGEGYWTDHWTYNLDLIDSFLAIYPDGKHELLFGDATLPFYDSPALVRPRSGKYVLAEGHPRQLEAVVQDEEKAALIASRQETPHLTRVAHGRGAVYRTTLFCKLVCLALTKFATMDPWGMGIEMEAGKPGWYDALNGLPGLFGASMPETYELQRLLEFLLGAIEETESRAVRLPTEVYALLTSLVAQLEAYNASDDPERDFAYWDAVAKAREAYRESIRMGFDGAERAVDLEELGTALRSFLAKVRAGVARAREINDGMPPTYLTYNVEAYDILRAADGEPEQDALGRPTLRARRFTANVLPLFLEGPVRAMKVLPDRAGAEVLYRKVKASPLYDRKLKMYKVNASLEDQPHDIGRARAFTPGWLENESIWLHMEYKYLLEVLKAGLYQEFFEDFRHALIPFQDPEVYGRSPLENSSFIVSSAHPDGSLHGAGFVARLSGSTAEFLSIWQGMMAGQKPFFVRYGQLCLRFTPALPGWLFDDEGTVTFRFLGGTDIVYHNPRRRDAFPGGGLSAKTITLQPKAGSSIQIADGVIAAPYAEMVRDGAVKSIDVFLE